MNVIKNISTDNDTKPIVLESDNNSTRFCHKSFEERVAEYDNVITTLNYDWGEPAGRELL
ncbi:MAG: hypothetical protein IK138_01845 [Lachnospiraceae bacterium]|nr:hypothetical protein [Lachnospiraceae bacterium]